jgi:hypothetical protein
MFSILDQMKINMLKFWTDSRRQVHRGRLLWKNPDSPNAQSELSAMRRHNLQARFCRFYIAVLHPEQGQMGPIARCAHLIRQVESLKRGPHGANSSIHSRIKEDFDGPAHKRTPFSLSDHKLSLFSLETTDSRAECEDELGVVAEIHMIFLFMLHPNAMSAYQLSRT